MAMMQQQIDNATLMRNEFEQRGLLAMDQRGNFNITVSAQDVQNIMEFRSAHDEESNVISVAPNQEIGMPDAERIRAGQQLEQQQFNGQMQDGSSLE